MTAQDVLDGVAWTMVLYSRLVLYLTMINNLIRWPYAFEVLRTDSTVDYFRCRQRILIRYLIDGMQYLYGTDSLRAVFPISGYL